MDFTNGFKMVEIKLSQKLCGYKKNISTPKSFPTTYRQIVFFKEMWEFFFYVSRIAKKLVPPYRFSKVMFCGKI